MDPHDLPYYQFQQQIGKGSYATVYSAQDRRTGELVAIKAINVGLLERKLVENLGQETQIMRTIDHPNTVRLIDLEQRGDYVYLVMELCLGGDLGQLMRRLKKKTEIPLLSLELIRRFMRQLVNAMMAMRAQGIAHRDLKPQNLLLTSVTAEESSLKVADFGFARIQGEGMDRMVETLCGSPLYMAPEVLANEPYDPGKSDVWSIGAILWEMIMGEVPYRAANHLILLEMIRREGERRLSPSVDPQAADLLAGLLRLNPDDRMDLTQIMSHPFLREHEPVKQPANSEEVPIVKKIVIRDFKPASAPRRTIAQTPPTARAYQSQLLLPPPPTSMRASGQSSRLGMAASISRASLLAAVGGGPAEVEDPVRRMHNDPLYLNIARLMALVEVGEVPTGPTQQIEQWALILLILEQLQKAFKQTDAQVHASLWNWLCNQRDWCLDRQVQPQISDSVSILSFNTSQVAQSAQEQVYEQAMLMARDGGIQELLGYWETASWLYERAKGLLELLSTVQLGPDDQSLVQRQIQRIQHRQRHLSFR